MDKERLDISGKRSGPTEEDCAAAAARARRAGGVKRAYGCLTRLSPAEGKAALRAAAASAGSASGVSAAPLPVNECTGDEDGYWYATRTMQCQIDPNVQYTYRDSNNQVKATALFATAQQLDLKVNSLQWTETDQITMLSHTGTLPAGLGVSWTTNCTAPCAPSSTKPWARTPIADSQNLTSTSTFVAQQPTSGYQYIDVDYQLSIGSPDAIDLLPPITWGGVEVRCDDQYAVTNTGGCVVPWYTPTLKLPRSKYGSSADMIEWAQHNLSGHWGLRGTGQPLHRLQGDSQRRANRNIICGSTKFTPDPNVQSDTCDEFPFAGTYETGALNGITHGKDCAQVTAVRAGTSGDLAVDWPTVTTVGIVTGTEKCVRGHIPGALNSDLGSTYGGFVVSERLADSDPFWLAITF
ncbi:hypothetical protein ACFZCY_35085 [Streptomyces sp. NPDC007983]|uniref:hypothetical protein n=1 Tax=Streptomyces sp. NPDC007983 TaxID=3364800 RepID=UPI0036E3362E